MNPDQRSTRPPSIPEKNHTIPAITAPIPTSHAISTGSVRRMRCLMHSATIPTRVDINVAKRIGRKISVGLAAPAWARYIIMLIGIKQSPDALRIRNIIMASVAVSFSLLRVCNSCMALSPSGVAALSRPSILAETFMKIDPIAGCPLGTPGNSRQKSGEIIFPKKPITPAFSPIFIKPSHSERIPVSPRAISNAVAADEKEADITDDHTEKSPRTNVRNNATQNAAMKKAIQM